MFKYIINNFSYHWNKERLTDECQKFYSLLRNSEFEPAFNKGEKILERGVKIVNLEKKLGYKSNDEIKRKIKEVEEDVGNLKKTLEKFPQRTN